MAASKPVDAYRALWRVQRLNTLERILLAQRLEDAKPGTERWLDEFVSAFPMDPVARSQRFETALRGSVLDGGPVMLGLQLAEAESLRQNMHFDAPMMAMGEGMVAAWVALWWRYGWRNGWHGRWHAGAANEGRFQKNRLESALEAKKAEGAEQAGSDAYFYKERSMGRGLELKRRSGGRFFQTLDQTREWAETQYHRIRLENQTPQLVPPGPFWQEFVKHTGQGKFLSHSLDLPVSNVNEALLRWL